MKVISFEKCKIIIDAKVNDMKIEDYLLFLIANETVGVEFQK